MPPTPALLLILSAMLPLISFLLLAFIGRRMGNPLAGYVAAAFVAGSFICSMVGMIAWFQAGQHAGISWGPGDKPINALYKWLPTGGGVDQENPGYLDIGVYVDSLTVIMFNMITLVALVIHVFALGDLAEDSRFPQFFTYSSLFCFAILALVLSATLLQLFVFWQIIAVCSYLLIRFKRQTPPARTARGRRANSAAIGAFVIGRIGDAGFLLGLGILFYYFGNVTILTLCKWLASAGLMNGSAINLSALSTAATPNAITSAINSATRSSIHLPTGAAIPAAMLTVAGIGLFFAAMAKSALFPLHTWLADAGDAPAPTSALIQTAAGIPAGVYLIARIFPILTPDAKLFIAIIGIITLTMGALIAVAQTNLKRLLAFSTISQVGYMMLALGVGSWIGAIFLLVTHAFSKSLLLLGAGSVIRSAHSEDDISQFGGLISRIPVTAITFAVGVLSIAGTPLISGHYSQQMILSHAGAYATFAARAGHSPWYQAFFILPTIVAYITAFYLTRCWMLIFWGRPRNLELHDKAREAPLIWFPLIILAVFTIVGSSQLLGIRHLLIESNQETQHYCDETALPGTMPFTGFNQTWPIDLATRLASGDPDTAHNPALLNLQNLEDAGENLHQTYARWAFLAGILFGSLLYINGFAATNGLMKFPPLRILRNWLHNEMFFEELYTMVFAATAFGISALIAAIDTYIINSAIDAGATAIRAFARVIAWTDRKILTRVPQSNRANGYASLLIYALATGATIAIVIFLHH
jgi:proton-translocating NADH-quinone oxidoreductase chain L